MTKNLLIIYALCGIMAITGIVYFLVAYGEYTDWMELLSFGIHDETMEKQVEITLFIVSGLIYFGLVLWLIKTRFIKRLPYMDHPSFSSSNLYIYRFKNCGCPNRGCRIIRGKTRFDFKNYANIGDCIYPLLQCIGLIAWCIVLPNRHLNIFGLEFIKLIFFIWHSLFKEQ